MVMQDGEKQIPRLIEFLHTCGVVVESVSVKKPNLDDVFLHFTGARIEQGDSFAKVKQTRRTFKRLS